MTEKPEFVSIFVTVTYFEPEVKQYLQRSLQTYFENTQVELKIPNKPEYISKVEGEKVVLTPAGLKHASDLLHNAFDDSKLKDEEFLNS